jgi:hypothetical protein
MSTLPPSVFQLNGAISLSFHTDCVLVPVYSCYPNNQHFVAHTDYFMNIVSFQDLDTLFGYIHSGLADDIPKTQFSVGDVSPVLLKIDNEITVIQGDDLDDIIRQLQLCKFNDSSIVEDVILDLTRDGHKPQVRQYEEDALSKHLHEDEVDPKAARLWLDIAVEGLYANNSNDLNLQDARVRARIHLLSWATKIANRATTPIFRHFVQTAKKIERRGVYVQDILGVAIVSWAYQDVSRLDWLVDLIRDFRRSYRRGPLATVIELTAHKSPKLVAWAENTIARYHDHIRRIVDTARPYELLAMTFVADDGNHWPPDVEQKLTRRAERHELDLRHLLDDRQEIIGRLEAKKSDTDPTFDRPHFEWRLRTNGQKIRQIASVLDSLRKSLSDKTLSGDYRMRFEGIDYKSLGLSEEFFVSLARSEEED